MARAPSPSYDQYTFKVNTMMYDAAITWIRRNCPNQEFIEDLSRFMDASASAGVNCWFLIGGDMSRAQVPFLLHCFDDELFLFQLNDSQAAARGVGRRGFKAANERLPSGLSPAVRPAITLDRFELNRPTLNQSEPVLGRLRFKASEDVAALSWCIRLDYQVDKVPHVAWEYPNRSLLDKGFLDVSFMPIAPSENFVTGFKGPLSVFIRLCEMSPPESAESRRPISNTAATLIQII
jgi:hypothetical protein